jgi:hypothetical protein
MYIDPGSGTMWWQLLLATFIGAVYYIRQTILRFAGKFWKLNNTQPGIEKQSD